MLLQSKHYWRSDVKADGRAFWCSEVDSNSGWAACKERQTSNALDLCDSTQTLRLARAISCPFLAYLTSPRREGQRSSSTSSLRAGCSTLYHRLSWLSMYCRLRTTARDRESYSLRTRDFAAQCALALSVALARAAGSSRSGRFVRFLPLPRPLPLPFSFSPHHTHHPLRNTLRNTPLLLAMHTMIASVSRVYTKQRQQLFARVSS